MTVRNPMQAPCFPHSLPEHLAGFAIFLCAALLLFVQTPSANADETNVCIACHGRLTGRLGEPVSLWKQSIHAAKGVFCNSCHGGNPKDAANAMNPAHGFLGVPKKPDIPAFCGRCHVGILQDYRLSAHGREPGTRGPTCVTCHENHRVTKASLDIINEQRCGTCHPYDRPARIKESMKGTEERIALLEKDISRIAAKGVTTTRLEQRVFSARNRYHTLFHDLDIDKVRSSAAQINEELNAVDSQIAAIDSGFGLRKVIGATAVGVSLLAALICALLKREYS